MDEKRYLNITKIKEFFDRLFNKEGFDYYYANKFWKELKMKAYVKKDLKGDKNYSPILQMPALYYRSLFLPSEDDIKKILNSDEVSEKDKKLLNKLISNGVIGGVAYITKGIIEEEGKKGLGYMVSTSTEYLKELKKYFDKGISKEEKEDLLKSLGLYISAVWAHEALGHGALGHLEGVSVDDNPHLTNILEDLVINSRIERHFPKAAQALKEKINGVWKNTWFDFPEVVKYGVKMDVLSDPVKYNLEDKVKPVDTEKIAKNIINYINKRKNKFNLFNEKGEELLNQFKENILKDHKNISKHLGALINSLLNIYVNEGNININAIDNIVLDLFDRVIKEFREQDKEGLFDKVTILSKSKDNKDYPLNIISKHKSLFGGDILKDYDVVILDQPKSKNNNNRMNPGEEDPIDGMPNGPLENGNLDKIGDIFREEDEFNDKLGKDEAEKHEEVLNKVTEEYNEKVNKEGNKKGSRPGVGVGGAEEKIKKMDIKLEDLERVLSNFISKFITRTFQRTQKRVNDVIPAINIDILRQQMDAKVRDIGAPFGIPSDVYLEPENDNLLFSIVDVSASMTNKQISAYKSAIVNTICSRGDTVVMEVENDFEFQGLKVLDSKRKTYQKDIDEYFNIKGRGGTGNFYKYIKYILNPKLLDNPESKNDKLFVERFKEEMEKSYGKEWRKKLENMVKNGQAKFSLLTDSDILSTDLFDDKNLKEIEKLSGGSEIIYLFVDKDNAERINNVLKNKGIKSIKVLPMPD